jgi:hypothetical protein
MVKRQTVKRQTVKRQTVSPPVARRSAGSELVREKPYSSVRGFAVALVLSDIVKRRSTRPGIAVR